MISSAEPFLSSRDSMRSCISAIATYAKASVMTAARLFLRGACKAARLARFCSPSRRADELEHHGDELGYLLAAAAMVAACLERLVPRSAVVDALELAVLRETGMCAIDGGRDLRVIARRRDLIIGSMQELRGNVDGGPRGEDVDIGDLAEK